MKTVFLSALMAMMITSAHAAEKTAAQIDHLAIYVSDQDASVAFYQGAFGFKEIHSPINGPRWFDIGAGVALHIIPGRTTPYVPEKSNHMAFNVKSLDPVVDYLKAQGVHWSNWAGDDGAITTRPDGVHQIYVQDPDGYWIEINDALTASE